MASAAMRITAQRRSGTERPYALIAGAAVPGEVALARITLWSSKSSGPATARGKFPLVRRTDTFDAMSNERQDGNDKGMSGEDVGLEP